MNDYFKSLGRIALVTTVLIIAFFGLILGYGHFTNLPRTDFPDWVKITSGVLLWFGSAGVIMFASRAWFSRDRTVLAFVSSSLAIVASGFLITHLLGVYLCLFTVQISKVLRFVWIGVFIAQYAATALWDCLQNTRQALMFAASLEDIFKRWLSENLLIELTPEERAAFQERGEINVTVRFKFDVDPDDNPDTTQEDSQKDSHKAEDTPPRHTGGHMVLDA